MPTDDAPTNSEWSTILLPTMVQLILEIWQYIFLFPANNSTHNVSSFHPRGSWLFQTQSTTPLRSSLYDYMGTAVFTKSFYWSSDIMFDDSEQFIRHFQNIIRYFSLSIHDEFFWWSDKESHDVEQLIRHFAKSSAMSDGSMAFREHWHWDVDARQ